MPSTTSSWVSSVLDSSTVMTPSLPTFFMASAMIWPIAVSLLAEMLPTWAIMSPVTGLENLSNSPLLRSPVFGSIFPQITSTAFSMPRFMAILQFDFFRDGDAVLGDGRGTEFLVNDNVAAPGAEGDLNRVRQQVDAAQDRLP